MLNRKIEVITLVIIMLPTLLVIFSFTDYMLVDYSNCCVYIITRTKSRLLWLAKKTAGLLGWVFAFYLLEYLLLLIFTKASGVLFDIGAAPQIIFWTILFNTLTVLMIALPVNLLAIKKGSVIAFLCGTSIYLLLLIAGMYSSPEISRLLPVSQGMYAWHQIPFSSHQAFLRMSPLPNFNIWISLAYLVIVIVAEFGAGAIFLKKTDLLDTPEGER